MAGSAKRLRLVISSAQPGGGDSGRTCATSSASSARISALAGQHGVVDPGQLVDVVGQLGLAIEGADQRLERLHRR
jgi:hypothetical protein